MKILIDMNLSPLWVNVSAKYDIEAIHWASVGKSRATDRVIMEWASANRYKSLHCFYP
jgi:predicted nuclease of predicted toxin-antitoxin system